MPSLWHYQHSPNCCTISSQEPWKCNIQQKSPVLTALGNWGLSYSEFFTGPMLYQMDLVQVPYVHTFDSEGRHIGGLCDYLLTGGCECDLMRLTCDADDNYSLNPRISFKLASCVQVPAPQTHTPRLLIVALSQADHGLFTEIRHMTQQCSIPPIMDMVDYS